MSRIDTLFPTRLYRVRLDGGDGRLAELETACRVLAAEDRAGRAWSKAKGYAGYTSYASLDDLPVRDPAFSDLKKALDRHAGAFARELGFDLGGRRLRLESLWVNVLKPGGAHSGHIHPLSVLSGTVYVAVPPGAGALKLEDPRLPLMMARPPLDGEAPEAERPFVYLAPEPGDIVIWESWLRHEVTPNAGKGERISLSFNYDWR